MTRTRLAVVVPVAVVFALPVAGIAVPRPALSTGGLAVIAGAGLALVAVLALRAGRPLEGRGRWWLAAGATAAGALVAATVADTGVDRGAQALVTALGVLELVVAGGTVGVLRRGRVRRWRSRTIDVLALALTSALAAGTLLGDAALDALVLGSAALAGAALGVLGLLFGAVVRARRTTVGGVLLLAGAVARVVLHGVEAARSSGHLPGDGRPGVVAAAALAVPLAALVLVPPLRRFPAGAPPADATWRTRRLAVPVAVLVAVTALSAERPTILPPGGRGVLVGLAAAAAALALGRALAAVAAGDRARNALAAAAGHDALTGLPGRDELEHRLLAALETGPRPRPLAVLLVDVDRFQRVNDTRGHHDGDRVLRELAARIETAAPAAAIVGRTGGDEFTVAVPDVAAEDEVLRLADRLLAVFDRPVRVDGEDLYLTGTVGIATTMARPDARVVDLFREADTALHRAKAEARGGATVFDAGMRVALERRVEIETQLRGAVDRGELVMHYQPVVHTATGTLAGFEALMRWAHPSGHLVGPNAFIAVAEETGLVVPMGSWAVAESLHQLRRWIDEGVCGRTAHMAVNLAARQLHDAGLVATVMGALHGAALPPHQLTLEVTETALLSDAREVERTIDRLKDLGVQIALDDFGTGYSSLAHLRRFPIDRIKVDRSFVGNLETSPEDRALVRSIVVMARELGKDVVAEGVETQGQLDVLTRIGCAKAQGYLFGEPLPASAVARRVARFPGAASVPTAPAN